MSNDIRYKSLEELSKNLFELRQNKIKKASEDAIKELSADRFKIAVNKDYTNSIEKQRENSHKQLKLNHKKNQYDHFAVLSDLEKEDFRWRLKKRSFLTYFTLLLLAGQNISVFYFVRYAVLNDEVKSLSLILSVLIAGTLTQTGYLMKKIYKLLFSPIDYKLNGSKTIKSNNPQNKPLGE